MMSTTACPNKPIIVANIYTPHFLFLPPDVIILFRIVQPGFPIRPQRGQHSFPTSGFHEKVFLHFEHLIGIGLSVIILSSLIYYWKPWTVFSLTRIVIRVNTFSKIFPIFKPYLKHMSKCLSFWTKKETVSPFHGFPCLLFYISPYSILQQIALMKTIQSVRDQLLDLGVVKS